MPSKVDRTYHLVSKHANRAQSKRSSARSPEGVQARSQEIHDYHIVVRIRPGVVNRRKARYATRYEFVDRYLVLHASLHYRFVGRTPRQLDRDVFAGKCVEGPDDVSCENVSVIQRYNGARVVRHL